MRFASPCRIASTELARIVTSAFSDPRSVSIRVAPPRLVVTDELLTELHPPAALHKREINEAWRSLTLRCGLAHREPGVRLVDRAEGVDAADPAGGSDAVLPSWPVRAPIRS